MRILLVAAALVSLGAAPALAESRVFIIENHGDYGVDECLALRRITGVGLHPHVPRESNACVSRSLTNTDAPQ